MISVVVPARNEGQVIARTLEAIVSGSTLDEIEVIVVCNGCTDDTAKIASGFGPPVRVIETDFGNKAYALNLGDQHATGFPRVYVDADVLITINTIRALASRLKRGDVLAVAPQPSFNLNACSRCVRAYYDIRSKLPHARQGIGGSGVYALSEAGRRRFAEFPSITADDGYVRIQFTAGERQTLSHVQSTVFAPRTIKDLILIRTRAYYGTNELARQFTDLWKNRGESNHRAIIGLWAFPSLWPQLSIYTYVNLVARCKAAARLRRASLHWERDNTSRNVAASADISGEAPL